MAPFKNIEIADRRAFLQRELTEMLAQNSTRGDFLRQPQNMIGAYDSEATSTERVTTKS